MDVLTSAGVLSGRMPPIIQTVGLHVYRSHIHESAEGSSPGHAMKHILESLGQDCAALMHISHWVSCWMSGELCHSTELCCLATTQGLLGVEESGKPSRGAALAWGLEEGGKASGGQLR